MSQPPPSQPSLEREMSNEEITGKPWSIDLQTMKQAPREDEPVTQPIASGDKGDLLDVLLTAKKWRFENMDKENWLVTVTYGSGSSLRFSEKIDKGKILKGNFAYYASKKVQEDVDFMNLSLSEIDDLLYYLETLNPSDIEDLSNLIIMIIDKYAECSDDKKLEIESKIDAALKKATGRAESSASALPGPPPARSESSALALPGPPPARSESSASALPAPPPAPIAMDLGSQPPTTVEDKTAIVSAIVKIYNVIDNTHDIQLVSNAIALLVIIKEDIQSRGIGIEQVNTAFINLIDDIIGNFAKLKEDIKTLQHSARSLYIKLRLFAARYDIYDLPIRLQMSINSIASSDMDKELMENMDVCQAYVMDGGFSNQLFETYQRRPYGITVNGVATVDGISPVGDPKRTILMNSRIIKNGDGTYTSGIKYAFQGKDGNRKVILNYDYMQLPKTIQIFGVVHVFADYRHDDDPKAARTIVVYTVEEAYFKSNISSTILEIESYRQARIAFAKLHKFDEEFFGLDVVTINGTKYCIIGASVGSVPVDFVGQQCAIASNSLTHYTTRCAAGELNAARITQLQQDTLFIPYEISERLNLLVLNTVKTVGDAAKPYAAQYAADFFNDVFFNDLSKNVRLKDTLFSIGFKFTTDGKMKVAVFTGDGFMQTFDTKDVMIWFGMKPNLTVYGVADAASVPIERNNRVIDFGFDKIEKLVKIAAFGLRKTSKLDTKNPPHLYTEAGLDTSKGTPMIWNKYSKLHNYALKNLNIPILVRNSFEGTNMQTYRSAQTHPIKQLLSIEKMVGIFRQGQIEQVSSDITERLMKNLITNTPETSEGYMQQYNITALVMLLDNFCNAFQIDPLIMLASKKRERRTSPVQNSYWFIDWLEQRMQSVFINQYQPYCRKDLSIGLNAVIVSVEQIKRLLPLPLPPLQLPPPPPPLNAQNNAKRRKTVKSAKGRSSSSGLSAKQKKQGRSASSGLKDASMSISPKQYTRKINQGKSASLDFSRETMSSEAKRRTKKASPGQATSMSISSPKPNPPWKLGGFIEKK
jgi:hypothetical protein